ncbi:MAG: hypothetical protein GX118_02655 [Arcobacter butzleri]|nr:hypothetical protein [Arcobacteraceae bacterium]NLO17075.1 hypothetical protein [Aliarcobacter butzleri]
MMKNILKITLLTLMVFGLIIYVTAPKQELTQYKLSANLQYFPNIIKIVGDKEEISKEDIFITNRRNLLFVSNHDSIAVLKDLNKYHNKDDLNIVLLANISSAPWFIKKWVIPSKLEELNQNSKAFMIYDENGYYIKLLDIKDHSSTHFVVFELLDNGDFIKIYESDVKSGALDGSMSELEIKAFIEDIFAKISK